MTTPVLNHIYNGDCIVGMQSLPDKCIDLVVTDPPYLMGYKTNFRSNNKSHRFRKGIHGDKGSKGRELISSYVKECYRVLKDDSAMYMFCNSNQIEFFVGTAKEAGFKLKNIIVWVKDEHTAGDLYAAFGKKYEFILLLNKGRRIFNGKRLTDVWSFSRVPWQHQIHQNQKPLALLEQCIKYHSDEDDVVLDGFMGSGSTAIAARNLGRNFIGWEIDKEYYDVAIERLRTEEATV